MNAHSACGQRDRCSVKARQGDSPQSIKAVNPETPGSSNEDAYPTLGVCTRGRHNLAERRGASDPVTDKLKATLEARLGSDAQIKGIAKSPIAGLYEVNLGSQIIYSDANGDYLLLGDLVDAKSRKNLTEARLADLNRIDFASLPFANAVKVVKGNGSRKIAVFSDPNCPYCRQLENTLKSVDNVTVYTFLYPVLSPDSTAKAKAIWCSADRAKAWEAWMLDRRAPRAVRATRPRSTATSRWVRR